MYNTSCQLIFQYLFEIKTACNSKSVFGFFPEPAPTLTSCNKLHATYCKEAYHGDMINVIVEWSNQVFLF